MGGDRLEDGSLYGVTSAGWRLTQAFSAAKAEGDIEKQKWVMRGMGACIRGVARECNLDKRYQREIRRVTASAVGMVSEGGKRSEGIEIDAVDGDIAEVIRNCLLSASMMQWAALHEGHHGILEFAIEKKALYAVWLHAIGPKPALALEDVIRADETRARMSEHCVKIVDFVLGA